MKGSPFTPEESRRNARMIERHAREAGLEDLLDDDTNPVVLAAVIVADAIRDHAEVVRRTSDAHTEAVARLAYMVGQVAGGQGTSPSGLEGLAMAIAGEGLRTSLAAALDNASTNIAGSVEDLRHAVEAYAETDDANH